IEMPGMNGYETAIDIRALDEPTCSVPIIFLSSNSEIEAVRRAIAAGGDDYLVKPVDEPRLLAKIAGLERHTAVRNQLAAMQRELKTLRSLARDNANLDPLTGCLNQDAFIGQLGHLWQDALRIHQPLCLLMIDIDALAAYNDALGHDAGDGAIKAVAEVMCREAQRPSDAIGRTDSADFGALFPGIDVNGAVETAERIRSKVAAMGFPHPSSETAAHLTISIGITVIVPENPNGSRRLLDEASRALFDAKDAGRNCALLNPMSLMR
ncbi:MAG: diguanylate cyclase, partial [Gammaproteobacteria bacterium]|nr:diguanylate cyclase [Gammaproteobacteria bacterium]